MIEIIKLADGRKELRQWDTGRAVNVDTKYNQIHFANVTYGKSIDAEVVDGVAKIPDELLRFDGKLYAYGYIGTYDDGYTDYERVFDIVKRPKPNGYVFTPEEQKTLAGIEKKIGDLNQLETTNKTDIVSALNEVKRNSGSGGSSADDGATFYPHVDNDGNLSWTNDKGLPNPDPVNIKGTKGDDYTLTDADKADIANIATEGISAAIDEIIALQEQFIGGAV